MNYDYFIFVHRLISILFLLKIELSCYKIMKDQFESSNVVLRFTTTTKEFVH